MIIFLNGVSSSGKSSIAKSLQASWPTPILHIGVDDFVAMLPARFCGSTPEAQLGLHFVPVDTQDGPHVEIRQGVYAKRLFAGMVGAVAALALSGNDMILDEVLFGDEVLCKYVNALRFHTVYFVAINCPLAVVEQRERARGDRFINSAKAQFLLVHAPTRFYDFELDTSKQSAAQLAAAIKVFVNQCDKPAGFKKLQQVFDSAAQ
jgi:chloramphenicol 3-O phosphotransferase